MTDYDLIIRSGKVATASDVFEADVAVKDGIITALGQNLEGATEVIDATGKLVLPGGVESHCHIAQEFSHRGHDI